MASAMHKVMNVSSLDAELLGILRASRAQKVVPLLLLVLNAALFSGRPVDLALLVLSVAFVFMASIFGMQLNVLTDRELDRATKPELAQQLNGNPSLLRWVLWSEGVTGAALLAAAAPRAPMVGGALAAYAALFNGYSFNFLLPGRGAELRLKAFWWGNALAVLGGYFALWLVGLGCGHLEPARGPHWFVVALAVSALDYGMFLVECAEDAPEERAHGLKTLPALLGRQGTIAIAALLAAAGVSGVLVGARAVHGATLLALVSATAAQAAAIGVAVLRRGGALPTRLGERLADAAFWVARVGTCVILLVARAFA